MGSSFDGYVTDAMFHKCNWAHLPASYKQLVKFLSNFYWDHENFFFYFLPFSGKKYIHKIPMTYIKHTSNWDAVLSIVEAIKRGVYKRMGRDRK